MLMQRKAPEITNGTWFLSSSPITSRNSDSCCLQKAGGFDELTGSALSWSSGITV